MRLIIAFFLFFLVPECFSQRISHADYNSLKQKEDSLKQFAFKIIDGRTPLECMTADSQFTRLLVKSLKIKNSFYYPFDSLKNISKLVPSDSTFKIFTWQMVIDENEVRQHGAIQMRTSDGSLKLFPLIDKSDVTIDMTDTVANNFGWMGAVYYKIIQTEEFGRKYYTLIGYDENNIRSNKKIIEVLTFPHNEPIFGGPFFSYQDGSLNKKFPNRFIMEYKKHAGPRLTFDEEQNMIIYEHLISETNEPYKKYTLVGDGDYEGLKWLQGKWVHIDKVFTFKLKDGEAPVPSPLKIDHGTLDTNQMLIEDNTDKESKTEDPKAKSSKVKGSRSKKKNNE